MASNCGKIIQLKHNASIHDGKYGAGTSNFYTKSTIFDNKDHAVFIFGANENHMKDRTYGGKAQAAQTSGQVNVVPIITMTPSSYYTDSDIDTYHEEITKIVKEFYRLGGTVVFPIKESSSDVNIGTGLAGSNRFASIGQACANKLLSILSNDVIPRNCNAAAAMSYFNFSMEKNQIKYGANAPAAPSHPAAARPAAAERPAAAARPAAAERPAAAARPVAAERPAAAARPVAADNYVNNYYIVRHVLYPSVRLLDDNEKELKKINNGEPALFLEHIRGKFIPNDNFIQNSNIRWNNRVCWLEKYKLTGKCITSKGKICTRTGFTATR